jgi:hypothetical protein
VRVGGRYGCTASPIATDENLEPSRLSLNFGNGPTSRLSDLSKRDSAPFNESHSLPFSATETA